MQYITFCVSVQKWCFFTGTPKLCPILLNRTPSTAEINSNTLTLLSGAPCDLAAMKSTETVLSSQTYCIYETSA